jgi:caffeoyl-CoA O-methyltransferase
MDFLDPKIEQYTLQHCEPESELLYELNRQTHLQILQPRMLSGHLQGRILSSYSKALSPNNVLEIGTYTGYSALCMAEGLKKNGTIHTIDINEELTSFTQSFLNKSKFNNQIKLHVGNALDLIPTLKLEWDLVFIDADKENYSNYFDLIIDKMNIGGIIIADNVLWSGKVINPNKKDKETYELDKFNKKIANDKRVEHQLLPLRDGLMIAQKI